MRRCDVCDMEKSVLYPDDELIIIEDPKYDYDYRSIVAHKQCLRLAMLTYFKFKAFKGAWKTLMD